MNVKGVGINPYDGGPTVANDFGKTNASQNGETDADDAGMTVANGAGKTDANRTGKTDANDVDASIISSSQRDLTKRLRLAEDLGVFTLFPSLIECPTCGADVPDHAYDIHVSFHPTCPKCGMVFISDFVLEIHRAIACSNLKEKPKSRDKGKGPPKSSAKVAGKAKKIAKFKTRTPAQSAEDKPRTFENSQYSANPSAPVVANIHGDENVGATISDSQNRPVPSSHPDVSVESATTTSLPNTFITDALAASNTGVGKDSTRDAIYSDFESSSGEEDPEEMKCEAGGRQMLEQPRNKKKKKERVRRKILTKYFKQLQDVAGITDVRISDVRQEGRVSKNKVLKFATDLISTLKAEEQTLLRFKTLEFEKSLSLQKRAQELCDSVLEAETTTSSSTSSIATTAITWRTSTPDTLDLRKRLRETRIASIILAANSTALSVAAASGLSTANSTPSTTASKLALTANSTKATSRLTTAINDAASTTTTASTTNTTSTTTIASSAAPTTADMWKRAALGLDGDVDARWIIEAKPRVIKPTGGSLSKPSNNSANGVAFDERGAIRLNTQHGRVGERDAFPPVEDPTENSPERVRISGDDAFPSIRGLSNNPPENVRFDVDDSLESHGQSSYRHDDDDRPIESEYLNNEVDDAYLEGLNDADDGMDGDLPPPEF